MKQIVIISCSFGKFSNSNVPPTSLKADASVDEAYRVVKPAVDWDPRAPSLLSDLKESQEKITNAGFQDLYQAFKRRRRIVGEYFNNHRKERQEKYFKDRFGDDDYKVDTCWTNQWR